MSKQNTVVPIHFFVIVCDMVAIDEQGRAVHKDGAPVYERNYFCKRLTNAAGAVAFEWDTDPAYLYRFPNETIAQNFLRVELLDLEGATVIPYTPEASELGALPLDNQKGGSHE